MLREAFTSGSVFGIGPVQNDFEGFCGSQDTLKCSV